jgi:hypothetical protein
MYPLQSRRNKDDLGAFLSHRQFVLFAVSGWLAAATSFADKLLMKDGRIFDGHIMGETHRSILFRPNTPGAKPFFVSLTEVQTVVRESRPAEEPSSEVGRFGQIETLLTGSMFSSGKLPFHAAPGLDVGAGFRLHPSTELGAVLGLWPSLYGTVSVSDGSNIREYDTYSAYAGGFYAKFFPLFRNRYARAEPYLIGGYRWNHLTPKGTDDYFTGTSWQLGGGVSWVWWKPVYVETRFVYQHVSYDTVRFQFGQGDINGVTQGIYTLGVGLAYRFL